MRRILWLAALMLVAAAGAGVAYAHDHPRGKGDFGNPGITDVAASATLAFGTVTSASCTGADGTYVTSRFNATGTIASGPLAGAVTTAVRWVMNTQKNDGYAVGELVVRNSDNTVRAVAKFAGAVEGKTLSGSLNGRYANGTHQGQGQEVARSAATEDAGAQSGAPAPGAPLGQHRRSSVPRQPPPDPEQTRRVAGVDAEDVHGPAKSSCASGSGMALAAPIPPRRPDRPLPTRGDPDAHRGLTHRRVLAVLRYLDSR